LNLIWQFFGLARSNVYQVLPKNLRNGFNEAESKNWLSLFDKEQMLVGASLLPRGYGQLSNRGVHSNRLAFIAHVKSLDKVYVHDLESSLRLTLLQERLEVLYGNEKVRQLFEYDGLSSISVGCGAVAFHKSSKSYVRVEIIAAGTSQVEVAPIDKPELGVFIVEKKDIYKVPKSLHFPRQTFAVRTTRHSDGQIRHYLSSMARCVLPSKTAVILNSEPEFGLVKITSTSCPKGVLSKIGFVKLGQSEFDDSQFVVKSGHFGSVEKFDVAKLDKIGDFVNTYAPKEEKPKKVQGKDNGKKKAERA